jgi:hypothetical protein
VICGRKCVITVAFLQAITEVQVLNHNNDPKKYPCWASYTGLRKARPARHVMPITNPITTPSQLNSHCRKYPYALRLILPVARL